MAHTRSKELTYHYTKELAFLHFTLFRLVDLQEIPLY